MAGYRPQYTHDEEKAIVNYLVQNNSIHRIKGDQVWKEMAAEKIVDRTWHSLKQHFRKKMIYQLHYPRYELDSKTLTLFKDHFYKEKKNRRDETQDVERPVERNERRFANFCERSSSSSDTE